MKKINNFFIKALLIVFAVFGTHVISPAIAITDKSKLKVGLYNDEDITTVRIQSFSGNWKAYFYPKKVEGAKAKPPQKEILIEGEDLAILLVKKGIIGRLSTGKDIEKGYERVVIKGGELMNIEIPNQPPLLLVGELEVLLDDPTLVLINQITIHQHLVSSVSKIGISTEPEALKAFIVIARTRLNFLLQNSVHKDEPYDLCDKSHCLPFQGAGANRELVDILINKVKDLTMTYKNKLFLPRYQNSCGGKISSAESVYGFNEPYHVSKIDRQEKKGSENCFHSPKFHWSIELTKQEILEFLADSFAGGANRIYTGWEPVKVDENGRIVKVLLRGRRPKEVSGVEFLEKIKFYFGENSIKSMKFNMDILRRSVIFRGMGQGHGVGLCIYGADGLAKKGSKYKEILEFYYPGIKIKK
jgi:SpoIID/LytB domain protein